MKLGIFQGDSEECRTGVSIREHKPGFLANGMKYSPFTEETGFVIRSYPREHKPGFLANGVKYSPKSEETGFVIRTINSKQQQEPGSQETYPVGRKFSVLPQARWCEGFYLAIAP